MSITVLANSQSNLACIEEKAIMWKKSLQVLALVFTTTSVVASTEPKGVVYISAADVDAVLKRAADTKRAIPDNTIRVVDLGSYQLGVAVIHHGPEAGGQPISNKGAGSGNISAGITPAKSASEMCGERRPGAKGPTGIFHYDTTETYYVTSGAATLVTGGTIVNGTRSGPNDEVTTVLNGPSCSGTMTGFTSREIRTGDIVVIPAGVPHGFAGVPDHITYISIRPDLKKVLQHGYVNPALTNRN